MEHYLIRTISPTLYSKIKSVSVKEIGKQFNSKNFTATNTKLKNEKSEKSIADSSKNTTVFQSKKVQVKNHILFVPSIIYMANIEKLEVEKDRDKNSMIEMQAMVRMSKNKFAIYMPWLIDLINLFYKKEDFYLVQYFPQETKDPIQNIGFLFDPKNEEKEKFRNQMPSHIILQDTFRRICNEGHEFGCINTIILSNVEEVEESDE